MSDPVSLIVLALVRGLAQGVAQGAVKDCYLAIRNQISTRYAESVEAGVRGLEKDPASSHLQDNVAQLLRAAGAERDHALVELAQNFLSLVENFDSCAAHSLHRADPVEQIRHLAGVDAINHVLQEHIRRVSDARANRKLNDVDLLSCKIVRRCDLPQELQTSAEQLHGRIRDIIFKIAVCIEDARYSEVEIAMSELPTGLAERERARVLVQVDKRMHVSYETLRLTVEFFRDLNRTVLANIENERSPQRLSNMMFGNAIMIYELTDFMIGYIESFSLGEELSKLRADAKERVQGARDRQEKLKKKVQESNVDPDVRKNTLQDIQSREAAFNELDREWDAYLDGVQRLDATVQKIRRKIPTLEIIRENAEIQIMALQEMAMLRFLKQSSESIQGQSRRYKAFVSPLCPLRRFDDYWGSNRARPRLL